MSSSMQLSGLQQQDSACTGDIPGRVDVDHNDITEAGETSDPCNVGRRDVNLVRELHNAAPYHDNGTDKATFINDDTTHRCTSSHIRNSLPSARDLTRNKVQFIRKTFKIVFCGAVCYGMMILILLVISIISIRFGSKNMANCPRQMYIPIYLVVGGSMGLVKALIHIAVLIHRKTLAVREGDMEQTSPPPTPSSGSAPTPPVAHPPHHWSYSLIHIVIIAFLVAWFIAGCVWVYDMDHSYQWMDPTAPDYCDYTLYELAYWITTCVLIIVGCLALCLCALSIYICSVLCRFRQGYMVRNYSSQEDFVALDLFAIG